MKKKDLEEGMKVELRNGEKLLVIKDPFDQKLFLMYEGEKYKTAFSLCNWDVRLKHEFDKMKDIVKVWQPEKIIWEREEKSKKLEALDESIRHWKRMIKWIRNRPSLARARKEIMKKYLGENWSGVYCSLCDLYSDTPNCRKCPLSKYDLCCREENSIYSKIKDAFNWNDWHKHAVNMFDKLKLIRSKIIADSSNENMIEIDGKEYSESTLKRALEDYIHE